VIEHSNKRGSNTFREIQKCDKIHKCETGQKSHLMRDLMTWPSRTPRGTLSVAVRWIRSPFTAALNDTCKADVRLPGKGNSNSHGARPVHPIITKIKWIRTRRLSIKNSLYTCALGGEVSGRRQPASAGEQGGNTGHGVQDVCNENGSSQGLDWLMCSKFARQRHPGHVAPARFTRKVVAAPESGHTTPCVKCWGKTPI